MHWKAKRRPDSGGSVGEHKQMLETERGLSITVKTRIYPDKGYHLYYFNIP